MTAIPGAVPGRAGWSVSRHGPGAEAVTATRYDGVGCHAQPFVPEPSYASGTGRTRGSA